MWGHNTSFTEYPKTKVVSTLHIPVFLLEISTLVLQELSEAVLLHI